MLSRPGSAALLLSTVIALACTRETTSAEAVVRTTQGSLEGILVAFHECTTEQDPELHVVAISPRVHFSAPVPLARFSEIAAQGHSYRLTIRDNDVITFLKRRLESTPFRTGTIAGIFDPRYQFSFVCSGEKRAEWFADRWGGLHVGEVELRPVPGPNWLHSFGSVIDMFDVVENTPPPATR